MIKKLLFMLTICGSTWMALGQKKMNGTEATVVVEQSSVKADSMWVVDPIKDKAFFVKPDAQGRFVITFKPVFPRLVKIGIDAPKKWRIELDLENGDAIKIETDYAANTKFSGKGAMKAEVLFRDTKAYIDADRKMEMEKIPANDLQQQFTHIADQSIAFLEANKQHVSPVFYKEQSIKFKYGRLGRQFDVPIYLKNWGGRKLSTVIPDGYWDLDKGLKMDDQLLSNTGYTNLMMYSYVSFLRLKALADQGMLDSALSIEKRTELDYSLIEKNYTGKTRSMALRTTLQSGFNRAKDVEVFKPLLDKYISQYATHEDATLALSNYNSFAKTNVGKVPPFFTLKDLDEKDVTLKDFTGKVVYMDFWASWCSPCRHEMQEGNPKLHAAFKDNKDVVFLYVSIDDRADLWRKAIAEDKIEGVHVLSAGGFNSPVGKAFNINGVPHYILIGKDGKIVDNNASRPSEDITQTKINEALQAK
ncbi:TlpA family protein disulfide reductase [Sphingobacterium sp. SRCM116780]|uniref:TlpA family protein disulfide reductase n=1 Tax=Sphingobacterium sp. SRCM116780 TaxID=2907623 RepID=UPI001F2F5CA6|nr:TlpA disulfide reductase family protein [Sphingobacterium sp. SRCM116780]UIR55682.1 TlpA family protein disulfide reductase [Sphingobacterium sp. SRCM116780]